jgi:hypothetical protein
MRMCRYEDVRMQGRTWHVAIINIEVKDRTKEPETQNSKLFYES